ncbi:MAG TPA: vitamin K epoxide reductase family protein [Vicinamibacterales bacterium]|nr:vitamin K epoxide reductase family protein [Vicinamibacterales bacterium]HPK71894.1 vitamin K epoxide reductase family protein [Vicinamibacterales bacterium]
MSTTAMSPAIRRVLALLALAGLASAFGSMLVHVKLVRQPQYLSFCDVTSYISCSTVYQSRYAELLGVPVALLGALWYVAVLVVLAGARWGWTSLRDSALGYVFLLSVAGFGFVLYMAYASLVLLKTICLLCVATYVCVASIFVISGLKTVPPMTSIPRRLLRDARAALASRGAVATVLAFLVLATTAVAFFPRLPVKEAAAAVGQGGAAAPADQQSEFLRFWEAQPRVPVPVSSEGAAVLVVRFSDFGCPSCGQTYEAYKSVFAKYAAQHPGAIKLVAKDFPLEPECNSNVGRPMHPSSCEAAVAARLAKAAGRGEAMEDWLYKNSAYVPPASIRQAAQEIGGVRDYDAKYAATINEIKGDIALATVLGVRVTPTFFINGVKLEGGLPPQYFDLALEQELKRAGKRP